jgi:hypothetical protein
VNFYPPVWHNIAEDITLQELNNLQSIFQENVCIITDLSAELVIIICITFYSAAAAELTG